MSLVLSFVCGVVLGMVPGQPVQVVQDGVGFTAVWERNVEQSDDPQEKMQAAMAPLSTPETASRTSPGGALTGVSRFHEWGRVPPVTVRVVL